MFEPDRAVTRVEIAVIFENFAKATGYTLPVTHTGSTYADASDIGGIKQDRGDCDAAGRRYNGRH